jgi:hypothetical protein
MLDVGTSFAPDGRPDIDKILERMPVTLLINGLILETPWLCSNGHDDFRGQIWPSLSGPGLGLALY